MSIALVWFRQDLRLQDNPAFIEACSEYEFVIPLYILDEQTSVLGRAQAWWLHHSLISLSVSLDKIGLNLILRKGNPAEIILDLIKTLSVTAVYWNRCYEPKAIVRDKKIKAELLQQGIEVESFNASMLNEPWTIKNKNGDYFKVFTPYWKTCLNTLNIQPAMRLITQPKSVAVQSDRVDDFNLLPKLNWAAKFPECWTPGEVGAQKKLQEFMEHTLNGYSKNRDFPSKNATSRLSPHLHFGEISPAIVVRAIELAKLDPACDLASADRFLSEIGWREFSMYLLYHFPKLPSENFKSEFDAFPWRNDEYLLSCWQKGKTGYPIIDAGMRELWTTGYMHNRVRMLVASFLTKGLLIDWRLGADWFLDTLVDADLANNSASWQWVAGSGVDAAPYFRIFNPLLQSQKFDPDGAYIRQWIPELSDDYIQPIINLNEARTRALSYYKKLKKI